jgi:hypothetical protein
VTLSLSQVLWDGLLRILGGGVFGVTSTASFFSFIHSALKFFLQGHDKSIDVAIIVIAVAAVVAHDHTDVVV